MMRRLFAVLAGLVVVMPTMLLAAPLDPVNPYETPTDEGHADLVNVPGTATGQQDSFVNVVKGAVNRVLGILALIALLFLLRGGFQMVTSGGDDKKYEAGFTILKHAAIGLLLIGVARFVVSIIFRLANKITESPGTAGTES